MGEIFRTDDTWGQVGVLKAGFDIFDKDGKLIDSKMWDARSYTRNFSRLVKAMFEFTNPVLTDITGTVFSACMASDTTAQGDKLIPRTSVGTTSPTALGINYTGAMLAVGTGALTGEDSAFFDLKAIVDSPQDARMSTATVIEDTTTIDFQIAEGITITNSSGLTITEIGLYARIRQFNAGLVTNPHVVLMAYDEVNPGVFVPNGGVIAPKYTLSFPV